MKPMNDNLRHELLERACRARQRAYAPYSHYLVGAALLAESGKIYEGVNIENAAYSPSVCAERVAMFTAVAAGERSFCLMAVATSNAGFSCGVCRQVLAEFAPDMRVLFTNEDASEVHETTVREMLPGAFSSAHLPSEKA